MCGLDLTRLAVEPFNPTARGTFMHTELCRKIKENELYREIYTLSLYSGFTFVMKMLRTEHLYTGESVRCPETSVTFRSRKEAYDAWDKV
jgi:hypothetical protein